MIILDSSSQKIFFRNEYSGFDFFRNNHLPLKPLFFGIPTLAFHVQIIEIETKENFIEKTILCFKNKGLSIEEISKKLCLNEQLVQIIIEDNRKNKCENEEINEDKVTRIEDFYIFYNLLSHEFMNNVIETEDFLSNLHTIQEENFNRSNVYSFRNDIGQSKDNVDYIRLLGYQEKGIFDVSIMPTKEQIIRCHRENSAFSYKEYLEASCFQEIYPVWLTLPYSVTREKNDFSIISPFNSQKIEFSNSLYLLIKKFLEENPDIQKYKQKVENRIIRNNEEIFRIYTDLDREIYEKIEKEFKDNDFSTPTLIEQMALMEISFLKIQKKYNPNDAATFFASVNNTLVALFTSLYLPFEEKVLIKLKEDNFFDKVEKQKTEGDIKDIIWHKFFEKVDFSDNLKDICKKCDPSKLLKSIKKKMIEKGNIRDLFVANMIVFHYFKNQTPFSMIFTIDIEMSKIQNMILTVSEQRNEVSHKFADEVKLTLLDVIKEYFNITTKIINECLKIKISEDKSNAIFEGNIEELSVDLLGNKEKEEISNFRVELQNCYVRLLSDINRKYVLYFNDCVTAFEELSESIIKYCKRRIQSLGELKRILETIPNKKDDAIIYLEEQLNKCNATCESIFEFKIDIIAIKEAIIEERDNIGKKSASTLILFAPMFLAATDNVGFVDLFNQLGTGYFETIKKVINNRGHDNQVSDWENIKDIPNAYKKYCWYFTKLESGEL